MTVTVPTAETILVVGGAALAKTAVPDAAEYATTQRRGLTLR